MRVHRGTLAEGQNVHTQGDVPGSLADVSCYGAESGMLILELVHCCKILKFQPSQGRETSLNTLSRQLSSLKRSCLWIKDHNPK